MSHRIERIAGFVDGFNLYHAVRDLGDPHLKWLDLWALVDRYAAQPHQKLVNVYYFSAFATWMPDRYKRHREYVKALEAAGCTAVLGRFKPKTRRCMLCGGIYTGHEEKETDVNIALYLLREAYRGTFDHAFLVSNDSDLAPVVRMVKAEFPQKRLRIITPPGRRTSKELIQAAGGTGFVRTVKRSHVRDALFPRTVKTAAGTTLAVRPPEYDPPS